MQTSTAWIAEFIGTFALMLVGGGAVVLTQEADHALIIAALAHGLILAAMVPMTMHISGGQFNPAVSIALAGFRRQPWTRAGVFIVAQLAGAVGAALLLRWTLTSHGDVGTLGATLGRFSEGEHASVIKTIVLEMIATFFLMIVIFGTIVDRRGLGTLTGVGGFCVGIVVAANIFFFGPLTGASMNPARSFGPALVAGAWSMHLAYWIAPIAGALLAALVYEKIFRPESVMATRPATTA